MMNNKYFASKLVVESLKMFLLAIFFCLYSWFEVNNIHLEIHSESGNLFVPLWKANAFYLFSIAFFSTGLELVFPRFTVHQLFGRIAGVVFGFIYFAHMYTYLPLTFRETTDQVYAAFLGCLLVIIYIIVINRAIKPLLLIKKWMRYMLACLIIYFPHFCLINYVFWLGNG